MSLFEASEAENRQTAAPLAARMRPRTLAEFVGQSSFLGEGKLLTRLLKADRLGSAIFHGPPGTGKTTLARLLANETKSRFVPVNAVTIGVKELREMQAAAFDLLSAEGRRTLLFVDEIHRLNRSQQDVLLPDVEEGVITLIAATTHNPFFALNGALVSRSRLFRFEPLSNVEIRVLVERALADRERGLGRFEATIDDDALEFLLETSDGDARRALSCLEVCVLSSPAARLRITLALVEESAQRKAIPYDAQGDSHYDAASALIKSIRGSDPDAALYWLAWMLEGGEDIRFLARRLVIAASEDIGNADPRALSLAVDAMRACEFVGLPECQLALSQAVCYLALAPKSNATTLAIGKARQDVTTGRLLPVPAKLRDAHYAGAERMGHGRDYVYSHEAPDGIAAQDYLGADREYYQPVERGFEIELKQRLAEIRERLRSSRNAADRGA